MFWFYIFVIAVIVYLYTQGKKADDKQTFKATFSAPVIALSRTDVNKEEDFSALVDEKEYSLVDYLTPTLLSITGKTLKGINRLVVWDSARTNTLRGKYNVKNVLQRLEFEEDGKKIEVYRAVNATGVSTYVFPQEGDDSTVVLIDQMKTTDDPSETASTNKIPTDKMNVFLTDNSMVPPALLPLVQNLEGMYKSRQSSSGPKSIDTHRS